MICRTNEHPNTQFIMQTLSHGLAGYKFPDILLFLQNGRKVILHFDSLDMLFRCYVYIWCLQPASADKMCRTCMYTSLCSPEYNEETIRVIDNNPHCQIILATVAFANGINAKALLDSVLVGLSGSLDLMVQKLSWVGQDNNTQARGVVLIQKSTLKLAQKTLNSLSKPPSSQPKKGKGSCKPKSIEGMDVCKAQFITESHCYTAFLNQYYQNPPLETSTLDCIAANRALPCILCLSHSSKTLQFPAPLSTPAYLALISASPSKTCASGSGKLKLTKKECATTTISLKKFRNSIHLEQH
ncbi:hypothetical protein K438DRAFT_2096825 [Mycena galopus ATCC 62051]|nr:hypothetical protein K438DRAFT_2096825 [Mycena galopus ATCC 62051]